DRGREVPEPRAEEARALCAREARVIGDERRPRDDACEDEVEAGPERMGALAVPEATDVLPMQRPPTEVEQRDDDDPDGELPHVAPDEADRPEERQERRDDAEEDLPEGEPAEAEHLLRERACPSRDDDQLEDRPAE